LYNGGSASGFFQTIKFNIMKNKEQLLEELDGRYTMMDAELESKFKAHGMPAGSSFRISNGTWAKRLEIGMLPPDGEEWRTHAFGSEVEISISNRDQSKDTISFGSTGSFVPGYDEAATHRVKVSHWAIQNWHFVTLELNAYFTACRTLQETYRMKIAAL
jgi:hypothetical protein